MGRAGMHGIGKVSLILPTFSPNLELAEMGLKCAKSYRDQVDEIIISEDSDVYWEAMHRIADRYVLHRNLGYTFNTNVAWRLATGDFALIVNSDTELLEGSVSDLLVARTITSPIMIEHSSHSNANISGACFCVPKDVWERSGFFGEDHTRAYNGADTELFGRLQNDGRAKTAVIQTVKVSHISGTPGPSRRAGVNTW